MPELPDVEAQRVLFAEHAQGRRVLHVRAPDADVLRNTSPQGLGRALKGRRFARPRRHGKWLIAPTEDGPTLVLHFGMDGRLCVDTGEDDPHDRVVWELDDGVLRLHTQRKLGGVWLVGRDDDLDEVTGPLGPDALALDVEDIESRLADAAGMVKPALTDQRRLAGLGNLLADEICWRAHIAPWSRMSELSERQRRILAEQTHAVLREAVPTGRVPPYDDWLTGARDAEDPRCPRCGTPLRHGTVGGRSTWWCPTCQQT